MRTFFWVLVGIIGCAATIGICAYAIRLIENFFDSLDIGKQKISAAEEREIIKHEYQQALDSQVADEPWTIRYATHPCPYCGHYKVRCAKWEDKQLSVAFWGIASGKIGKNYKCEDCGKMW